MPALGQENCRWNETGTYLKKNNVFRATTEGRPYRLFVCQPWPECRGGPTCPPLGNRTATGNDIRTHRQYGTLRGRPRGSPLRVHMEQMYDSTKHNRRSIRLPGYDYSQPGLYYVTNCTQHKLCLFGKIVDGKMLLNKAGQIIEDFWLKIEDQFETVELNKYIIIPNQKHPG